LMTARTSGKPVFTYPSKITWVATRSALQSLIGIS